MTHLIGQVGPRRCAPSPSCMPSCAPCPCKLSLQAASNALAKETPEVVTLQVTLPPLWYLFSRPVAWLYALYPNPSIFIRPHCGAPSNSLKKELRGLLVNVPLASPPKRTRARVPQRVPCVWVRASGHSHTLLGSGPTVVRSCGQLFTILVPMPWLQIMGRGCTCGSRGPPCSLLCTRKLS